MDSYFIQWIVIHYYQYFVAQIILNLAIGTNMALYFNIILRGKNIFLWMLFWFFDAT